MSVCNKVKIFLTELITNNSMKKSGGVELQLQPSLTSALDGIEWSASWPGRFTPEEQTPVFIWCKGG